MNTARLAADLVEELDEGGLRGSFLVRDLHTGREIGIDPDVLFPVASLIKVPLAAATAERIRLGELDGSAQLTVQPGRISTPGPTGLTRFRYPARIAVDDLLYLSMSISDGVAADALFGLTPPAEVNRLLRAWELHGITARHLLGALSDTPAERLPAEEGHLAHSLAISSGTSGRGHRIQQLDVARANTGSARAFVDLLQALWTTSKIDAVVQSRIRELMGTNLLRQRLAPDFTSDATTWFSKTGTLLNLRHEAGVVEHADGQAFAIAALTESRISAVHQPEAEVLMARVARVLRDHLRHG
ncbi:serine hydrolase [Saccharopolyspora karakumensis]|uniref:Serine hydrolase n=1 Tax=Saccharopolyspora karakumensis TaxID=2530386 RepID=A0A4R5C1U8_9PSEU|nr:serine hydrolase [Saccharopolyspora karakumensis]TDD92765.1 serine hydrolase [Saccharopolyspora karakumensis]